MRKKKKKQCGPRSGAAPDQKVTCTSTHLHHLEAHLLRLRPDPLPTPLPFALLHIQGPAQQLGPLDGPRAWLRRHPPLMLPHPPRHGREAAEPGGHTVLDQDLALQTEMLAALTA